jgi:hypothetical protein
VITVIFNITHEAALTGGTTPACDHSDLFRTTAVRITGMRAGEPFTEIVKKCNKTFADQIGNTRGPWKLLVDRKGTQNTMASTTPTNIDLEIGKLYHEVVRGGNGPLSMGNTTTNGNVVLCWSCNGWTFEFKDPCLRCQHLYSEWVIYGMPKESGSRYKALKEGMQQHNQWWNVSWKSRVSHHFCIRISLQFICI